MLRSLVRWKFVDRNWGPETLALITKFWLRLYSEATQSRQTSQQPHQTLELRLMGFTRSTAQAVSDATTRRLHEAGLPVEVSKADHDTLVAITKPRDVSNPVFAALGIEPLAGVPFDGLLIEIRFTVADAGATEPSSGLIGATLVIVGELRRGTVEVKSLWADPAFVVVERVWAESSPWEEPLLAAFDGFRNYDKVDVMLASHLFNPQHHNPRWLFDLVVRALTVPFGQPRLPGLLLRCFVLIGIFAVSLSLVVVGVMSSWPRPSPFLFLLLLNAPTERFIRIEQRYLYPAFKTRRATFQDYFHNPARYGALLPSDPKLWLQDTVARKLTAEVLEAGFVYAGDAATLPLESADTVHCVFLAPDGSTYLVLAFRFALGGGVNRGCIWPVAWNSYCQTFDSQNRKFETLNFETPLVALKRTEPTMRWKVVPHVTHPLELFDIHVKAVAQWMEEVDSKPRQHEPFNQFVARQIADFDRERQVYQARPYSWRDHIRWYLQLDAKPSPESK